MKTLLKAIICIFAGATISFADTVNEIIGEGTHFHDQGKYDAAIAKYKEAEKLDPKNALLYYEMAYSYYAKRDIKASMQSLKKAEKLNTDNRLTDAICNMLGNLYDEMKMPDSAIATYRKGAKSYPNSYLIPFNAAITFTNMNQLDSASTWIEKAANINKHHENTFFQATIISLKKQDWVNYYSYGMYSLLIGKKTENRNELYKSLYNCAKKLVLKSEGNKAVIDVTPRPFPPKVAENDMFLLLLGSIQIPDSANHKDYTKKDTTTAQQMEFLTHIFTESVKLIADMKENKNPLTSFYQGLVKNNFAEAFAYQICKVIDRPTYAKWVIKNKDTEDKMFKWLNEEYAKSH